jgi:hypothetical protein
MAPRPTAMTRRPLRARALEIEGRGLAAPQLPCIVPPRRRIVPPRAPRGRAWSQLATGCAHSLQQASSAWSDDRFGPQGALWFNQCTRSTSRQVRDRDRERGRGIGIGIGIGRDRDRDSQLDRQTGQAARQTPRQTDRQTGRRGVRRDRAKTRRERAYASGLRHDGRPARPADSRQARGFAPGPRRKPYGGAAPEESKASPRANRAGPIAQSEGRRH